MNIKPSDKIFNIVYIGHKKDYTLNLFGYLSHNFNGQFKFKQHMFDPQKFKAEDIYNVKPDIVLFETHINETKLKKVLKTLNEYNYPTVCSSFALFSDLTTDTKSTIDFCKPNFCFKVTTKGEEIKFLSNTIVTTLLPELPLTKNYAIAKPNTTHFVQCPVYLKEFTSKQLIIESSFKLNVNRLTLGDTPFSKIVTFDTNNLQYTGTYNQSHYLLNKYSHNFNHSLVTKDEEDRIKVEIDAYLATKSEYSDEERENIREKFVSEKKKILLKEKKHLFFSWYKKNPYNKKQSSQKKNIIVITKSFVEMDVPSELESNYNITVFKSLNPDNILKIKEYNPSFIIWDMETPRETIIKNGVESEKIIDICYEKNYFKSLGALKDDIGLIDLNEKNKLIIFSDSNHISKETFLSEYGGLAVEIIPSKASPATINAALSLLLKESLKRDKVAKDRVEQVKETPDNITSFFEINDENAKTHIQLPITIELLTEVELVLSSTSELPMFTPLKISGELPLTVTLVPAKPLELTNRTAPEKKYRGFIHGITEEERKVIRSYVIRHEKQYKRAS